MEVAAHLKAEAPQDDDHRERIFCVKFHLLAAVSHVVTTTPSAEWSEAIREGVFRNIVPIAFRTEVESEVERRFRCAAETLVTAWDSQEP